MGEQEVLFRGSQIAGILDVSGNYFRTGSLNKRYILFGFLDRLLFIAGFEADCFAGSVDLITEVINTVGFFLINSTDLEFDLGYSHIVFHN